MHCNDSKLKLSSLRLAVITAITASCALFAPVISHANALSSGGAQPPPEQTLAAAPRNDEQELPDQYGVSAEYGYTFDPSDPDLTFLLARFFAIYDYGTVWRQDRPKALRFKVEGAVGSTLTPESDLIASANMLALYYPGKLSQRTFRPYVEAGIGVIYTEFRVKGQAYHWNFNPLLGVGCELPQQSGKNPFAAIRLHHLSNAGLDGDNRGVNSVVLQVGRYF
jgi:lipid A 3-O-deacylase